MELDGLARCLAQSRAGNGGPNDLTWKKLERLINLCPNCHFKSINKLPAIKKTRQLLETQKERKPPFDRLYPPSDQLLDIKPETIYHFEELEQRAVLALCKYLCFSNGQYLHKLLPLLLRYLCTLHLANWPPHYFKNLFLMKYQHTQNTETLNTKLQADAMNSTDTAHRHQDVVEEETKDSPLDEHKSNAADGKNLIAIEEEPEKQEKVRTLNSEMDSTTVMTSSGTNKATSIPSIVPLPSAARDSFDHQKPDSEHSEEAPATADSIEIKYDEDIPDGRSPKESGSPKDDVVKEVTSNKKMEADLMKYMDNPLRSPLCQFVMELMFNIGDISHAVEESAPMIRQSMIVILKEYIKILEKGQDDATVSLGGDDYDGMASMQRGSLHSASHQHSLYVVLPIVWGILNAIKEDVSIHMDRNCAKSISKCVDTLSKYNRSNAFSALWKSEWDILSTGVRASLLAYFLPATGPIEKAPVKLFDSRVMREYFKASMEIIGVKKSPSSIEVREQHMRLATIIAIYERSVREKLKKTIEEILTFHISKYVRSRGAFVSPSKQKGKGSKKGKHGTLHGGHHPRALKYRMRDQTILINACCLVLEQLAERAPAGGQLQEISYYFQRLLIDPQAIYLEDEEINERLMDALARVCQCELKYMEQNDRLHRYPNDGAVQLTEAEEEAEEETLLILREDGTGNVGANMNSNGPSDVVTGVQLEMEEKYGREEQDMAIATPVPGKGHHHKNVSSGVFPYAEPQNKHWYHDSSTRTVFNELENNFNDSVLENGKLLNRALRIYGAMMVKVNHKFITQQFLTSSLKSKLAQKLTVMLPYLIDTAIQQQETETLFVKEIVQLLVQSYLTKTASYQLDTKRKIAEAFTELSSNLTLYRLRQFLLAEMMKLFTAMTKEILNNHRKKKGTLVMASNELGLILPAIAVLCTPLYPVLDDENTETFGMKQTDGDTLDEDLDESGDEEPISKKKRFGARRRKRDKKRRGKGDSETEREQQAQSPQHQIAEREQPADSNPSYFGTNQYVAEQWGVTLDGNHSQTVAIFREFWNQIIFFDFVSSTSNEYKIYLQTIAAVTPVLVSGSSQLFGGGLIHQVLKNKTNSMPINKQITAMRSRLAQIIKLDVQHLEPDALLFLNVVYHVELFRVYDGTAYALAHYLNDAGILRMDLQPYIEAIVDHLFSSWTQHVYRSKASSEKLVSLESHTEYLLAMCCSRSTRIRSKCYDWLQHKLVAAYSYLQWRPKCLQNVLDIVSKLESLIDDVSTELYSSNDSHSVIVFNNKFSLDLPEDRKSRAEIRSIILDIAGTWLHSAWNLAPSEMVSVVAHKLSLYRSPLLSSLMYTQCKVNAHRDGVAQGPNMGLMFVVSRCERYLGVMEGLYRTHLLHYGAKSFGQSKAALFIQTFKRYIAMQSKLVKDSAHAEQLQQGMVEEMYQVGALIVWTYNKSVTTSTASNTAFHFKLPLEELLHLLCMVPAIVFTQTLVMTGTFVWRWIMTTSPELQEALIRQMRSAWSFVIEQRKGIFATKHVDAAEIEAHDIWISWLLNSMENIIESSPESVENMAVIMMDGLSAIAHDASSTTMVPVESTSPQLAAPQSTTLSKPKMSPPRSRLAPSSGSTQIRSRFGSKRSPVGSSSASGRGKMQAVGSEPRGQEALPSNSGNSTLHNDDQTNEERDHQFDSYIATVGATLRFYTAVARILNALRLASVPLLSKTIATMLRGRLYQGVLGMFECEIVWRYPSSWKHVSSNAKSVVELFQFFMTEHRHIIKRHYANRKDAAKNALRVPSASHNDHGTSLSDTFIPAPPAVHIENHRSKSSQRQHVETAVRSGDDEMRSATVAESIVSTTMPYLGQQSEVSTNSVPLSSSRHSHHTMQFRHYKTQSGNFRIQRSTTGVRALSFRERRFAPHSKTQRSPSIRRNSFGHIAQRDSFDLDDLFNDDGHGGPSPLLRPHHRSGLSNGSGVTSLFGDTVGSVDAMTGSAAMIAIPSSSSFIGGSGSGGPGHGAANSLQSNSYLFKLDSDDVYYWEGNNAFIQEEMTQWLHTERGWAQMMCCVLLADELERLCAWYNTRDADNVGPAPNANGATPANLDGALGMDDDALNRIDTGNTSKGVDDRISKFMHQEVLVEYIGKIGGSQWSKLTDTAWSFTPLLAVRFYQRFKYRDFADIHNHNSSLNGPTQTISDTLRQHIHREPRSIQSIPDAVHLLITNSTVKTDGIELEQLCQFECAPLYKCLPLLTEDALSHSIVNQYLFRSLRYEAESNMEGVIFLIPQLLQALRFDPSGMLRQFLMGCAANDLTMAHQLVWLCDCESFEGEDRHSPQNRTVNGHEDDSEDFCKEMERLSEDIRSGFRSNGEVLRFYQNEFAFFDAINCASADVDASKYSKAEKKKLIRATLIGIRDSMDKYQRQRNRLYMPTNPTWEVVDVLPDSVIALQSAAKVPFLVDFVVRKYDHDVGHMLQMGTFPDTLPPTEIQKCIFKTHDDCGQDALALQIIEYFRDIFEEAGLPLLLFPYRVIATRSGKDKVVGGMIELVRNARSRSELGAENGYRLKKYFIETYGDVESRAFRKAQRNFILSLAGYAVVCYLLQIKDRHNANIMINSAGHLIHIDFGFLFDISPGKNIGFERAGFKINDEMVELIGDDGSHTTPLFLWFVELCIRGYLVCREHMDEILAIIELSSNSNLPCFLPQTMANLRSRFVPEKSTTQAAEHMKERVIHACSTWTTNAYDKFQLVSQGIWKAPAKDEE